ncbi:MAG: hypothetical protein GWN01_13585 [Nitrosopumilaceae archaeon]|nr:hypothetical protein [Nitrosopumilaceae archaeon]NIU01896.1 hypothetical protein [Nitrosopumilaceae archaeon]NIU88300.1 hypothetical protein [Nitrosopumilaceae archaeon]NIV66592.1 hypothetical protein [Nitrosopumilaceae archaeon]NIX62497.1 hypothetical protein [Nitrosopumilaceae archaeon]
MKYYVNCQRCHRKFYVSANAMTRSELPSFFELRCPFCGYPTQYLPRDVYAEISILGSQGTAVLGGLLGLAAGGVGALLGATLGAAVGRKSEQKDREDVERFNSS